MFYYMALPLFCLAPTVSSLCLLMSPLHLGFSPSCISLDILPSYRLLSFLLYQSWQYTLTQCMNIPQCWVALLGSLTRVWPVTGSVCKVPGGFPLWL